MLIGFDLDGTLVETWTDHPAPGVVGALGRLPKEATLFLATNQGGPAWREVTGDPKYPDAADTANRILTVVRRLRLPLAAIVIATDAGKALPAFVRASEGAADLLREMFPHAGPRVLVSPLPYWRKPAPGMLYAARQALGGGAMCYIGDRDEDRAAAAEAGAAFLRADVWRAGQTVIVP